MSIEQKTKQLKRFYDSLPEWYWKFGLHDAKITLIYEDFDKGRSFLEIHVDATGAMFEQDVTKIKLYDYKIISPDDIDVLEGGYWITDSIEALDSGRYLLKAEISCSNDKDLVPFEIRFSDTEVERKGKRHRHNFKTG